MPTFRNKRIDIVIDVRSRIEFWFGHLDGAICIPVGSIASGITQRREVRKDSRILLVCASGARSARAADILRQLGYQSVTDGGMMSTAKADYTP